MMGTDLFDFIRFCLFVHFANGIGLHRLSGSRRQAIKEARERGNRLTDRREEHVVEEKSDRYDQDDQLARAATRAQDVDKHVLPCLWT